MRKQLIVAVVSAALLALVCWPASWGRGEDSFPLSPYPMFARKKTTPTLTLEYAVALDSAGNRSFVAPELIGSGEVLQARALIHGAISGDGQKAQDFCQAVLARVQADRSHIVQLHLVRGTHDSVAYLRGDTEGGTETVLVRCKP